MPENSEATGNFANWPPNLPGKPTRVAVFGVKHSQDNREPEILFTGDFPELEKALYWAAKKEMHAVRRQGWLFASRVAWQHDLSPAQAVAESLHAMKPQLQRLFGGQDFGEGPLRPIDPQEARQLYVEFESKNGKPVPPPMIIDFEPTEDDPLYRDLDSL